MTRRTPDGEADHTTTLRRWFVDQQWTCWTTEPCPFHWHDPACEAVPFVPEFIVAERLRDLQRECDRQRDLADRYRRAARAALGMDGDS